MAVIFGVDARELDEAELLGVLAEVARVFDESPAEMVAMLAEAAGPARWMSFRSSVFRRDRALAEGFFVDVMSPRLPMLVVARVGERGGGSHVLRVFRRDHLALEVRSNGLEVVVVRGTLAADVDRTGDAVAIGLRALGWPDAPDLEAIGSAKRVVVLRAKGAVPAKMVVGPRRGRLLPVQVVGPAAEAGFEHFAKDASERFPWRAAPIVAAPDEVVRLDLRVGPPARLAPLASLRRITGQVVVHGVSSVLPDEGVEHFDLGGIRELRHPGRIAISGEVKSFRACALEAADTLDVGARVITELPALRRLRFGAFGQEGGIPRVTGIRSLVLPALEEVKKLRIVLPLVDPFEIRLPALCSGEVVLRSYGERPIAAGSVVELPRLGRSAIKLEMPAARAKSVKALLAR